MDSWGRNPHSCGPRIGRGSGQQCGSESTAGPGRGRSGGQHVHDGDPLAAASQRAAPGCPAATASPDEGVSRANRAKCAASAAAGRGSGLRGFGASGLFANRLLCSRPLPWRRSPATACFEPAASCPRTGTWLEMCTVDSVGQCKWPRGVAWLSVGVAPRGHVELVWTGHSSLAGTDGL